MELAIFVLLGAIAAGTAAYVIIARNPINSAISLIVSFLAMAGIYVLLNAHFLAVIQVLVYAGAIMVLFLFVIMLLNLDDEELGERRAGFFKFLGAALTAIILGILVFTAFNPTADYCYPEDCSSGDCAAMTYISECADGFSCTAFRSVDLVLPVEGTMPGVSGESVEMELRIQFDSTRWTETQQVEVLDERFVLNAGVDVSIPEHFFSAETLDLSLMANHESCDAEGECVEATVDLGPVVLNPATRRPARDITHKDFGQCKANAVELTGIDEDWGGIEEFSAQLFAGYLLPFEVVSITLLVAIIGAMLIAKRRD